VGAILNKYFSEIVRGTKYWSDISNSLFLGQSIAYVGNVLFNTLEAADVPMGKRLELPVFEEVQMGMSTGLALSGILPISMFPRFDFLLLAMNQLVTHLDKLSFMSCGQICPKVIIKTLVGSSKPLHPGFQHCGDYTDGLRLMLNSVEVIKLENPDDIFPSYVKAAERNDGKSTLIVEIADLYKDP
jgi:pyruvate/2-oxoglutarate/acetoin dehydrogenase E1 component